MLVHTIRFKLTIWFVLTVTLIMIAGAFFWDRNMATIMLDNIDQQLLTTAEEVEGFHLHRQQLAGQEGMVCAWMEEFIHKYNWGVTIQQLTPEGELVCTTDPSGIRLPLEAEALNASRRNRPFYKTYDRIGKARLRVLTYGMEQSGKLTGLLQIGKGLARDDANLEELQKSRLIYMPLLVLCLGACGWFLAGHALAPVNRIAADIRKFSAQNLNQRLPIDSPPNELTLLSVSFNDMLERLDDSFNRIRQFTGDASHELRTPLAILKGETEVTLRWGKGEEELRATLASNLEEIERMQLITEDLLCLAKSESGELRLSLTSFSLNDLAQDIYLVGNTLGETKGIQVVLWLNVDQEVFIVGDQMHLHRALLNLVSNAVKYTPGPGTVEISLDLDQHQRAVIRVRDTGIGIPPEHLPHIFERFYRVDEARNRSVGGTGLGLAIVKTIVEAHQGTIEVLSTPGEGSIFTLHLPLQGPTPGH